jgi:hypothetical protein
MPSHLSASPALDVYLSVLAGSCADGFFDVRWRSDSARMRRRFLPAADARAAARVISRRGAAADVYVGAAVRDGCLSGGRAGISGSHLAWVESDDPGTADRLEGLACPPTLMVASGTPGHLQLYWRLDGRYPLDVVERANRRLAVALAGDAACADGARILRPPGTYNHKHDPPRPVELLRANRGARCTLAELTVGLPQVAAAQPAREACPVSRTGRTDLDRALLAVPAREYVRVLTGLTPNREGKVRCPFHEDRDPSLQLYDDGSFFCFGSGCRRGGSIYDFASHLWGIPPRGVGFLEISGRLAGRFDPACSGRP